MYVIVFIYSNKLLLFVWSTLNKEIKKGVCLLSHMVIFAIAQNHIKFKMAEQNVNKPMFPQVFSTAFPFLHPQSLFKQVFYIKQ